MTLAPISPVQSLASLPLQAQRATDTAGQISSPDGLTDSIVADILSATPTTKSPTDILAGVKPCHFIIQDFSPLAESIDWELGQLYWNKRGSKAFTSGDVPFAINNDGILSANAAEVFFVSLTQADENGQLEPQIHALEMGCGAGLFARYFLDAFQQLCLKHNKNYYERFCYIATDRSERMLEDLARHGILANHPGRYQIRLLDALQPKLGGREDTAEVTGPCRAIFLNYLLDALPATVLKLTDGQVGELCIRTSLAHGVNLKEYTTLRPDDLARLAVSGSPDEKRELVDLYSLFVLDYDDRPVELRSLPYGDCVMQFAGSEDQYVLHSYGAIRCIEQALELICDGGFILVNDYGLRPDGTPSPYHHQHFGASTAISVNFPLLRFYCEQSGKCRWVEPLEENEDIFARLLGRNIAAATADRFRMRFSKTVADRGRQSVEAARTHLKEGRYQAALSAYSEVLKRQPHCWVLMAEIARFLITTLHDYSAGLEMAKAGLAMNPISPDLWNTLGDSLFYLNRTAEAHQAFLRVIEIDPRNVRARYNLIYTFAHCHDYGSALRMVAEGLIHDKTGEYRQRLLERQSEILGRVTQHRQQESRLFADRFCFSGPPAS